MMRYGRGLWRLQASFHGGLIYNSKCPIGWLNQDMAQAAEPHNMSEQIDTQSQKDIKTNITNI